MFDKTCRRNQKLFLLMLICVTGFGSVSDVNAQDAVARPNIINIIVDDMGFSDIGSYGGEIKTPHIDSLAMSGIRYSSYRRDRIVTITSPTEKPPAV